MRSDVNDTSKVAAVGVFSGSSLLITWRKTRFVVSRVSEVAKLDRGFAFTRMVYTHVLNRPGIGVRSRLDHAWPTSVIAHYDPH